LEPKLIASAYFESCLIDGVQELLKYLLAYDVEPPIFVMLSLVGVRGHVLVYQNAIHEATAIDRDVLAIPEIIFDGSHLDVRSLMRPCFDAVWNACGFPRSMSYNPAGQWTRRQ
jgi:hypothetical protein